VAEKAAPVTNGATPSVAAEAAPSPAPVEAKPPVTEAAPPVTQPAETPKPEAKPQPEVPLFTLPEGFKPPQSMVDEFTKTMKDAFVDGKLNLTPQQVVDLYHKGATQAAADWQKQIETTNSTNEAECRKQFTNEQLEAARSGVAFFKSFDPTFADWAKRQLNDPTFVRAMRVVGEALGEDVIEPAGPPAPAPRTAAQRMGYEKSN
jgi:hypothetical protein